MQMVGRLLGYGEACVCKAWFSGSEQVTRSRILVVTLYWPSRALHTIALVLGSIEMVWGQHYERAV